MTKLDKTILWSTGWISNPIRGLLHELTSMNNPPMYNAEAIGHS